MGDNPPVSPTVAVAMTWPGAIYQHGSAPRQRYPVVQPLAGAVRAGTGKPPARSKGTVTGKLAAALVGRMNCCAHAP